MFQTAYQRNPQTLDAQYRSMSNQEILQLFGKNEAEHLEALTKILQSEDAKDRFRYTIIIYGENSYGGMLELTGMTPIEQVIIEDAPDAPYADEAETMAMVGLSNVAKRIEEIPIPD